jgi:hypothetical protein
MCVHEDVWPYRGRKGGAGGTLSPKMRDMVAAVEVNRSVRSARGGVLAGSKPAVFTMRESVCERQRESEAHMHIHTGARVAWPGESAV